MASDEKNLDPAVSPAGKPPPRPLRRSEQPILTDGQLGGAIERGPERVNPEGSSELSNEELLTLRHRWAPGGS